jgi:hypothetical protein
MCRKTCGGEVVETLFCLRPVARFVAACSEAAICNTGIIYLLRREVKYWQNNDYISILLPKSMTNVVWV